MRLVPVGVGVVPFFSFIELGRGRSLNSTRRMKLTIERIPKKAKQPNHPKRGRMRLLATMPRFAERALAK
jgi:hypothetical protein